LDNSGIIGASKRPRFDFFGGEPTSKQTLAGASSRLGSSAFSALKGLDNYPSVKQGLPYYDPDDPRRGFDINRSLLPSKGFATGGSIPDQAGVDTIPTMLSGGEFVMNSAAANKIGQGNLERMNSGISETGSSDLSWMS
jgi:hypothetical protein